MLTPEQKLKVLQHFGYDPLSYDVDDSNNIIERDTPLTPTAPESTALGAAGRFAKQSLLPAVAGLGAAAGATALTGGGALIPILAGLATGVGTGYAQNKVIEATSTPEETAARQAQMQADIEQHPYASFGGALLPQMLAFRPSPSNVSGALRTLLKGGDTVAKANLANVGVNAGLGAVTEGVLPYLYGGEPSLRDVALGAGAGALLNKPWLLGPKLFPTREMPSAKVETAPQGPAAIEDLMYPQQGRYNIPQPTQYGGIPFPGPRQGSLPLPPGSIDVKPSGLRILEGPMAKPKITSADFEPLSQLQELALRTGYNPEVMADKKSPLTRGNAKGVLSKAIVAPEAVVENRAGEVDLTRAAATKQFQNAEQARLKSLKTPPEMEVEGDPITGFRESLASKTPDEIETLLNDHLTKYQENLDVIAGLGDRIARGQKNPELLASFAKFAKDQKTLSQKIITIRQFQPIREAGKIKVMKDFVEAEPRVKEDIVDTTVEEPIKMTKIGGDINAEMQGRKETLTSRGAIEAPPTEVEGRVVESEVKPPTEVPPPTEVKPASEVMQNVKDGDLVRYKSATNLSEFDGVITKVHDNNYVSITNEDGAPVIVPRENIRRILTEPITIMGKQFKPPVEVPTKVISEVPKPAKEPWQMTKDEWHDEHLDDVIARRKAILRPEGAKPVDPDTVHSESVIAAVKAGKPVSPEVLADYPDLVSAKPVEATQPEIAKGITKSIADIISKAPDDIKKAHNGIKINLKGNKNKESGFILNPGEALRSAFTKVIEYLRKFFDDLPSLSKALEDLYGAEIKPIWESITGGAVTPALKGKSPETGTPRRFESVKLGSNEPIYRDTAVEGQKEPSIIERMFGSQTENLRRTMGKSGEAAANSFDEWRNVRRAYMGKWSNSMLASLKGIYKSEYDKLYKTFIEEDRLGKSLKDELPANLHGAYDKLRGIYKEMAENQIAAGQPVMEGGTPRQRGINPNSWFNTMDRKAIDILANATDSPAAKKYKEDFIDHRIRMGETPQEAKNQLDNLLGAMSSKDTNVKFGAVRKAEGLGLPDSWIEPDFKLAVKRYTQRFAGDRAFWDTIETNPELMWLLGERKNSFGQVMPKPENPPGEFGSLKLNEQVKSIMEQIQGNFTRFSPTINALSRVVNSLILGPVTGVTDVLSTPFNMMRFMPASEVGRMFKSIGNWKEGYANAIKSGLIKRDFTTIDELAQAGTNLSDKLNNTANFFTKLTGRQATETLARTLAQSMGEEVARFHIALAKAGNKHSIDLLNQASPGRQWETIDPVEMGTRFAELVQGKYDYSSLPKWVNDSMLAPLVKLSRWNIEQANNFMKYVWKPMTEGNPEPMLISILGGAIGGTIIKEVREVLNNKETNIPSWMEIASSSRGFSGNIPAAAYQLMAVTGYTGVSGALADIIRGGFDVMYGNMPTGYRLPLYEVATGVAQDVAQATSAIMEAGSIEEVAEIALRLQVNLLSKNVQALRIGANNAIEHLKDTSWGKEGQRKKESRDLRVFKMVEGMPMAGGGGQTNPYTGITERKFKLAETPEEALSTLGPAVSKVMGRSRGDPEAIARGLSNLKYSTSLNYPSLDSSPDAFVKYGKYLEKAKGKEEAEKRLQAFLRRREVNRFKSSLLP